MDSSSSPSIFPHKETRHTIVQTSDGQWSIISELGHRQDAQVFSIDGRSGRLVFCAQPDVDVFPDTATAIDAITTGRRLQKKQAIEAVSLIGYLLEGTMAAILIVTKVRTDLVLPGSHAVQTVEESQWIRVQLTHPLADANSEIDSKTFKSLTEYPLDGLHFYCETHDITQHFPSSNPPPFRGDSSYEPEFSWNEHLASPFSRMGMRQWCVVLMQGLASGRAILCERLRKTVHVALISRKSNKNPGTRYNARGMNDEAAPGNEYECEQLVWCVKAPPSSSSSASNGAQKKPSSASSSSSSSSSAIPIVSSSSSSSVLSSSTFGPPSPAKPATSLQPFIVVHPAPSSSSSSSIQDPLSAAASPPKPSYVPRSVPSSPSSPNSIPLAAPGAGITANIGFSSYVWRRGTVPIFWKSEMKSTRAEVEIIIADRPYEGIEKYYQRLFARCGRVPILACNLLRLNMTSGETLLSSSYQESLQVVRKLLDADVRILNFDWHHNVKSLGIPMSVTELWRRLGPHVEVHGITVGSMTVPVDQSHAHPLSNVKFAEEQKGLLRVNCADSLDRTNIATFFNALQVMIEQCSRLGIDIVSPAFYAHQKANSGGGGKRYEEDGHVPKPNAKWRLFHSSFDEVKAHVEEDFVTACAELFVMNGDIISLLYTNTSAMHSSVIREFAPHLPSAPNNIRIILERRFQNVVNDKSRQTQYEIFLGQKREKHFPHGSAVSHCISHYPAWVFKTVPSALVPSPQPLPSMLSISASVASLHAHPSFSSAASSHGLHHHHHHHHGSSVAPLSSIRYVDGTDDLLLLGKDTRPHFWICPRDHDVTEITIFLPVHCRVMEMAFTIRHGKNDTSPPMFMDVFVGQYIDKCLPAFQGIAMPHCDDGTRLVYNMPPHISGVKESFSLYDFEGHVSNRRMRVVQVIFHGSPSSAFLTLGQIEVFGRVLDSEKPPTFLKHEVKMLQMSALADELVNSMKAADVGRSPIYLDMDKPVEAKAEAEEEEEEEDQDDKQEQAVKAIKFEEDGEDDPRSKDQDDAEASPSEPEDQIQAASPPDSIPSAIVPASLPQPPPPASPSSRVPIVFASSSVDTPRSIPSNSVSDSSNIREYLSLVSRKIAQRNGSSRQFSFNDALELELARLRLRITPQQRDTMLVAQGERVADFDPNRFVVRRDERVEEAVRKAARGPKCKRCNTSSSLLTRLTGCRNCRASFCRSCISPTLVRLIEFDWEQPEKVCADCHRLVTQQQSMLAEIRILAETQQEVSRSNQIAPATPSAVGAAPAAAGPDSHLIHHALSPRQALAPPHATPASPASASHSAPPASSSSSSSRDISILARTLYGESRFCSARTTAYPRDPEARKLLPLSSMPGTGILASVPTAEGSVPVEAILVDRDSLGPETHCWTAPSSINACDILISLPGRCIVRRLEITAPAVGYLGYRMFDAPEITVMTADRLPALKLRGQFKLPGTARVDQDQEIDWNEAVAAPGAVMTFDFDEPVACRIVSICLNLPKLPAEIEPTIETRNIRLGRVRVLGTLESPFISPSPPILPAYAEGMQRKFEDAASIGSSIHRNILRNLMVKTWEDNVNALDLYLELTPELVTSPIMGFRIDIRHGEEGPSSQIRRVRVTLSQKSNQTLQINMGEFIVPKVQPQTVLYFDFDPSKVNRQADVARFEFLTNYGGRETVVGRISCFFCKAK